MGTVFDLEMMCQDMLSHIFRLQHLDYGVPCKWRVAQSPPSVKHPPEATLDVVSALDSNAFNFIGSDVEVQCYGFPPVGVRGNLSAQLLVEHGIIIQT